MPVPSTLASLSTTAASNSPSGGENPFPDLDNHLRAHSAFLALLRDNGHQYLSTVGGTVDVITGSTVSASPTSYSAGQVYWFKSTGANTSTTPTININAIGAKTIVRQDGSALVAGDIASGKMIELYYDGTNMVFNNCPRVPKADLATTATSATSATTATTATTANALASGATGVTPTGGDNSTKVPTTAFFRGEFTGANQSLGTNGYQKLPGGLILQWGYNAGNAAGFTVSFPTAFPNAVVNVTGQCALIYSGAFSLLAITAINTSNFSGFMNSTGSVHVADAFFWTALGY